MPYLTLGYNEIAFQSLVSHAPVVPTKILGDPVELDKHLIENGFGDIFSTLPPSNNFSTPYIFTGQQTDFQLHVRSISDILRERISTITVLFPVYSPIKRL